MSDSEEEAASVADSSAPPSATAPTPTSPAEEAEEVVVLQGFLTKSPPLKKADAKSLKSWKQRYFVLKLHAKRLEYYADSTKSSLKGFIDLNRCFHISDEVHTTRKQGFVFCLAVPDRKYFLVAGSQTQRDKWINSLREVCRQPYRRQGASAASTSAPPLVGRPAADSDDDDETSSARHRHATAPAHMAEAAKPSEGRRSRTIVDLDAESYRRNTGDSAAAALAGSGDPASPAPSSPGLVVMPSYAGAAASPSSMSVFSATSSLPPASPASVASASSSPVISAAPKGTPATISAGTRPAKAQKFLIPARTQHGEAVYLYLSFPVLQLLRREDRVKIQEWPFQHMRGYGQDGRVFQFETGTSCPTGEGIYTFTITAEEVDVVALIDKLINENAGEDGVSYQMMAWHKDSVADPSYDRVVKTMDSRTGTANTATPTPASAHHEDPDGGHVPYSAIDEVKTQALHTAMATHKRQGDGTKRPGREDVTAFGGYNGSPNARRQLRAGSLFDPSRHKPEAAADPKKRRYVNVSNTQLVAIIKHEQGEVPGPNPVLTLTLANEAEAKQGDSDDGEDDTVREIDEMVARLTDQVSASTT